MKFRCTACSEWTPDISPLGPEGVIICEDCARTPHGYNVLEDVERAISAAITAHLNPKMT